jgi:hypothetical protein
MSGQGDVSVEQLKGYLRDLTPGARALLISELERGLLRGDNPPGAEMILAELRRSQRDDSVNAQSFGEPARLYLQPIEPFVVDDDADHMHRGRISRLVLEPLWRWVSNTLAPDEARTYVEQVEKALVAGDTDKAEYLARAFQDRSLRRIQQSLEAVAKDDRERQRIVGQLGTANAIDDVRGVCGVLNSRDGLAMLGAQLPGHIVSLSGAPLIKVKELVDSPLGMKSDLFLYSLVLVMSRLAAPWQLIRLATRTAGSDEAGRIAETPYAVAVNMVLDEIDRKCRELARDLKSGRGVAVAALLKEIHDALRGMRSELDLPIESAWGRQLATLRGEMSRILTAEIDLMPGRVRRLLRPRPSTEISPDSVLDADEVADAEMLVGFVVACRNYAGELAINEVTQRTFNDLRTYLEAGSRALIDALRAAGDSERPFRQSQIDAAVRFCAKVFGQDYATQLAKAAEVASHVERKAAARA